jgi:hypothetical protein
VAGWIICLRFILQVLTANIGTLLDVYGVEKGLEDFRSTSSLNFEHYKYYLQKEVLVLYIKALELLLKYNFHEYVIFVCLSRLPDNEITEFHQCVFCDFFLMCSVLILGLCLSPSISDRPLCFLCLRPHASRREGGCSGLFIISLDNLSHPAKFI